MNTSRWSLAIAALALVLSSTQTLAIGSALTYQGELQQAGTLADGEFDMQFALFSVASGGTAIFSTLCRDNVQVAQGRFTVRLDFGAAVFDGSDRYLQIAVRPAGAVGDCNAGAYTPLTPRQSITAAPYAIQTRGLFVDAAQKVAVGHDTPEASMHVKQFGGGYPAIQGESSWIGVFGRHDGAGSFPGVWGETSSTSSSATGVRGYILSTSPGASSAGVLGVNNGTTANGSGVFGSHAGNGIGVWGKANGSTGTGVRAEGAGTDSTALEIRSGGIRVPGAGANTATPIFQHTATAANSSQCDNTGCYCYTTTINNPLCDGTPNAILFVQVSGEVGSGHPRVTHVYYDSGLARSRIQCEFNEYFCHGQKFNVLCVTP